MSEMVKKARKYEMEESMKIAKDNRPVYHFSNPVGWMNDPNGFSDYKGEHGLYAASDFKEGISKPDQTGPGRNAYLCQRGRLHHYHQKRRTSSHAGRRGDFKTNQILRKWRLL